MQKNALAKANIVCPIFQRHKCRCYSKKTKFKTHFSQLWI